MRLLRSKIENSFSFIFGGALLAGFVAGIGAYSWGIEISGRELSDKATLCPEGQFSIRFDITPKNAEISYSVQNTNFFQGMCLEKGRHQFKISSEGYKSTMRTVHLDKSDRVEIVTLPGIINIDIDGSISKKYPKNMERLSLNFQHIEVGAVLQLLADFTGQNIAVQQGVNKTITLRLNDVPWEEAFDTILLLNGLKAHHTDNIIIVSEKN